jgi:hypothetical protein
MMTTAARTTKPTTFSDILDKGMVIDAFVRVSLVGIELLTIDARVVIASVDTYLRFAEAVNRLDLYPAHQPPGLPEMITSVRQGGAKDKTRGALQGVKEAASDIINTVRRGKSSRDEHREHEESEQQEEGDG